MKENALKWRPCIKIFRGLTYNQEKPWLRDPELGVGGGCYWWWDVLGDWD